MNIIEFKKLVTQNKLLLQGFGIALFVFVVDQITKYFAFKVVTDVMIRTGRAQNMIKVTEFFNISKVWNTGISFGMFRNMYANQVILSAITIVIIAILVRWMMKIEKGYLMMAVGITLGGAFGNLTDRLRFGAVADFLDFHIGTLHWPSFNIADLAVCIGVFIILLDDLFLKKKLSSGINRRKK
jgi:signal peptidase II